MHKTRATTTNELANSMVTSRRRSPQPLIDSQNQTSYVNPGGQRPAMAASADDAYPPSVSASLDFSRSAEGIALTEDGGSNCRILWMLMIWGGTPAVGFWRNAVIGR